MNFWTKVAGIILRNRYVVLIVIASITAFLVTQTKHIRFSYTEANLLPDNHPENVLSIFKESGYSNLEIIDDYNGDKRVLNIKT